MNVVITFDDLPYVELRANYHKSNFWGERAESTRIARSEAYLIAKQVATFEAGLPYEHCEIEEVFTIPTKRRMDIENLIFGAKSFLDGIVDAGIIVDDSWQYVKKLSGRIVYKKGCRQTEIIITEVEK
jgi:crossover junction endodeoxyribonuclease RusA